MHLLLSWCTGIIGENKEAFWNNITCLHWLISIKKNTRNSAHVTCTFHLDAETVKLLNTSCPEYVHGPEVYHSVLTLLKVDGYCNLHGL